MERDRTYQLNKVTAVLNCTLYQQTDLADTHNTWLCFAAATFKLLSRGHAILQACNTN